MGRTIRIATSALAVIGGFFVVLRICWLAHVEPAWLPYAAHVLGAAIAGAAIAASTRASTRDGAIAGVIAIAVLAVVAFALPSAFGWIAARSSSRWLVAAAIAIASGAATAGGVWLFRRDSGVSSAAILVLATCVCACTVMLGGRIIFALGLISASPAPAAVVGAVMSMAAGVVTQAVVPARRIPMCGSGAAFLIALHLAERIMRDRPLEIADIFYVLLFWPAGVLGAYLVGTRRG